MTEESFIVNGFVLLAPTVLMLVTLVVRYNTALENLRLSAKLSDAGGYTEIRRYFRRSFTKEVCWDSLVLGIVNTVIIYLGDLLLGTVVVLGSIVPIAVLVTDNETKTTIRPRELALVFSWIGLQVGILLLSVFASLSLVNVEGNAVTILVIGLPVVIFLGTSIAIFKKTTL